MKTSDQIDKLAGALAKAQATIEPPPKNRTAMVPTKSGGSYSYKYADLADIIEAVKKPLAENGLAWTSGTESNGHTTLHTRLVHTSGQWIEASYPLLDGLSAQQMGSAITYGRRYTLCALLGIVAEDDDDGQTADAPKRAAAQKPAAPPKQEKPAEAAKPAPAASNHWIGAIISVESPANGKWKIKGGDAVGTEFGTVTPEHADVARSAKASNTRVSIKFATQTSNNIKRILSIEPVKEETNNG